MSPDTLLQTPLAGLPTPAGQAYFSHGDVRQVALIETPLHEIVNLRGQPDNPAFAEAVASVIGLTPPALPNTLAENDQHCIMWLAPDEWLIYGKRAATPAATLVSRVETALAHLFSAATDQSSAYATLQLQGPQATAVLNKGCPLDLHPRAFGPAQCAQSHYFKTTFLLRRIAPAPVDTWQLIVRRSFADYAARMLLDAMIEYA